MKTDVAFGRTGLTLDLPEGPRYEVLHAHSAAAIADVDAALAAALDAPIGCASLAELARGKRTAAISVCDITRPAPNRVTLPPLLRRLHAAGMRHEDITICIATGLHREATRAELDIILGPEIAAAYPILNHDAKNKAAHRYVGDTKRGTPVWIERPFLDADLHITLGFIEQHLMLGFSGGRKLIAPGLAAQETIKVIHSPRFMREALATEGSYEDNPLHAELLEVARMARHDFMLDVTLTQTREISGIFAGAPEQAHHAGVNFLRGSSLEYLPEYVDAAITSAAGYPLDLTFYQTIKGVTAVQHILKPGGKILVVSECAEGIGSPEFAEMVAGYEGAQSFLDSIADTPVVPDQWQLERLALVARKHPVSFYAPGTTPAQLGGLAAQSFATAEEAVDDLLAGLPADARIAVIPEGPYAFARVAG
ncbi:Nickel-dependent lactate racemase [Granulicella rosea]|uniref:Nickel-dependent lactate racemase n=1 Tax=Granulicella rosea TaxID=474952 RepID=A0A239M0A9_9BACT|nr:nickel-dependent lactate racemase [Granulicella rosea]SNT36111.1 Nickel-dependent lactate racemase [Granulicella rosea]